MSAKTILVSIHDASPAHFECLRQAAGLLSEYGLRGRYALFVVPDFMRAWPLQSHPEFLDWLRGLIDEGAEIVLHGYFHFDETDHRTCIARWKSRTLTAKEGEFLGLDRAEAERRLLEGKRLLETLLNTTISGFVAPAWLYGEGVLAALRALDFGFAENHWRVWSPRDNRTLARTPVVNYASRDKLRLRASLGWSRIATLALSRLSVVRFALHPRDMLVSSLVNEARRALARFLQDRSPISYRELVSRL